MLAIGYKQISQEPHEQALQSFNVAKPAPAGHDLLVEVHAISVNPVDTKIRKSVEPAAEGFKILGWDALGVVVDVGADVSQFKVGDKVYYAGDVSRQGANAQYQLVDERIVGRAPTSLTDAEAAALPLTSITAWELLFHRLGLTPDKSQEGTILVVGGAGGVGSMLLQLVRQLTSMTIVATASREESQAWAKKMGAHHILDHRRSFEGQLSAFGIEQVDVVASLTHSAQHFASCVDALKPQGKYALIDDPDTLDIKLLKRKSISLHWEFMFTRPLFHTPDIAAQSKILNDVAALIDTGKLVTTVGEHLGEITVENLLSAHRILESGEAIGKLVLEGFAVDDE